jgi:hypothetical protein
VKDIGGVGPFDHWIVIHDHRFELDYEIASQCDYWEEHRMSLGWEQTIVNAHDPE